MQNSQFGKEDYEIKFDLLSLIYLTEIKENAQLNILIYILQDWSSIDI